MLLNKYLVTYKTYEFNDIDTDANNNLEKIDVSYASGEQAHQHRRVTLFHFYHTITHIIFPVTAVCERHRKPSFLRPQPKQ